MSIRMFLCPIWNLVAVPCWPKFKNCSQKKKKLFSTFHNMTKEKAKWRLLVAIHLKEGTLCNIIVNLTRRALPASTPLHSVPSQPHYVPSSDWSLVLQRSRTYSITYKWAENDWNPASSHSILQRNFLIHVFRLYIFSSIFPSNIFLKSPYFLEI